MLTYSEWISETRTQIDALPLRRRGEPNGYFFFEDAGSGLAFGVAKGEVLATALTLSCFGFLVSRLLRI
jgi:hypothetical protein